MANGLYTVLSQMRNKNMTMLEMVERQRELALYYTFKGHEMLRLYQETRNEIYKELADCYLRISEDLSGPKLFKTIFKPGNVAF